jgi:transposase
MTDSGGIPLAIEVSAANRHDVNYLLPLVFRWFPRLGGLLGRPRQRPRLVRADSGYTSQAILDLLAWSGIEAEIPQRGKQEQTGLGRYRWPVERTLAWLKQFRRVGIRRERKIAHYEAFVTLACAIIAFRKLT